MRNKHYKKNQNVNGTLQTASNNCNFGPLLKNEIHNKYSVNCTPVKSGHKSIVDFKTFYACSDDGLGNPTHKISLNAGFDWCIASPIRVFIIFVIM